MAVAYTNLGSINEARGSRKRACRCWRKARDLYREMGLTNDETELDTYMRELGCGGAWGWTRKIWRRRHVLL